MIRRRRKLRDREELETELRDVRVQMANEPNIRLEMYLRGAEAALLWAVTTSGDPIKPTRMVSLIHLASGADVLPFPPAPQEDS